MAWTKTDEETHIQPQIGEFVIWALAANKVSDTDMKFYICFSYTTLSFFQMARQPIGGLVILIYRGFSIT